MNNELQRLIAKRGLRMTTPRQTVFDVLHKSSIPMSIPAIAAECPHIDKVSVYRTITLFTQLNIAQAIPVGWKRRYELTDPFKLHHHHLSCVKCGRVIDVESSKIETAINTIASENHFVPSSHTFEVRGLCRSCH